MAELWANIIRSPNKSKTITIGVSHHHLFCKKNFRSSPAMPILFVMPSKRLIGVISYLGFDQDGRPVIHLLSPPHNLQAPKHPYHSFGMS
jgi:hypothetical protein